MGLARGQKQMHAHVTGFGRECVGDATGLGLREERTAGLARAPFFHQANDQHPLSSGFHVQRQRLALALEDGQAAEGLVEQRGRLPGSQVKPPVGPAANGVMTPPARGPTGVGKQQEDGNQDQGQEEPHAQGALQLGAGAYLQAVGRGCEEEPTDQSQRPQKQQSGVHAHRPQRYPGEGQSPGRTRSGQEQASESHRAP